MSVAEILIQSVIKSVGKREFLKTVDKMFGQTKKEKQKKEVKQEYQCQARVKGERTGVKVGRHVLFESARCDRKEISSDTHLCKIHSKRLHHGLFTQPLTEEQQKTFAL